MSINRKKAKRARRREREQYKLRGERQLFVKIESAMCSDPLKQRDAGKTQNFGTTSGRMSSAQSNLQAAPRQRIINQAAIYLAQRRRMQGLE